MNAAASGVGHGAAGYGGHGASAGGRHGGGGGGGATGKPVKVVLCQQYSQAGNCERGEACQFAHGLQELHYYRARQVRFQYFHYRVCKLDLVRFLEQFSIYVSAKLSPARVPARLKLGQKSELAIWLMEMRNTCSQ